MLNIIAPICNTGYGLSGANIVSEIVKSGVKAALFPIGQIQVAQRIAPFIEQALQNAVMFDKNLPCVRIWHQFDMAQFVGKGQHIGFPIFELDTFTPRELHHLNNCDKLFVCSEWAKRVARANGISCPITVVPLGVDSSVFSPKVSTRKPTIFLNVGKWEVRKGHDVLVDMFNSAFDESDDVELWMLCNNPFLNQEETAKWVNKYKNSKLGHKIRILPPQQTEKDVAAIMQQADCGVFPARAEGWNLEALEMLSCGKYIITTNYSGHTEYCTFDNSFLVPVNKKEKAFDGKWFTGQGNWGMLDTEFQAKFIWYMHQVHKIKKEHGNAYNPNGLVTAKQFSWSNTINKLLGGLNA